MSRIYKNETPVYRIPSIGAGDYISEADEERQAQIIETQLTGAIVAHSGGHGLFRSGTYSTAGDGDGFVVTLNPDGATPAAEGFIRLVYFKVTQSIQWAIQGDGEHKLFVQLVETDTASTRQFGDVAVDSTQDEDIPDDALLVATAAVLQDSVTIDAQPLDILELQRLDNHIERSVNPHTTLLNQDQMIISGLTTQTHETRTLTVADQLKMSGLAIFQDQVIVDQDLIVGGNLIVSGVSSFQRDVTVNGDAFISKMIASTADFTSGVDFRSQTRFFEDIEVESGVTIDGRDVGQDGLVLDDHTSGTTAFQNPHRVTAAQVSGIPHTGSANGGPTLQGNLDLLSGVAIDGIDPSFLIPLIDGSNADSLHTHDMSGIPSKIIANSPEYCGAVLSGAGTVLVSAGYDAAFDTSFYKLEAQELGQQKYAVVVRTGVPNDFRKWPASGLTLWNGVSNPADPNNFISIRMTDTLGNPVVLPNAQEVRNPVITESTFITDNLNAGLYIPGGTFTTIIEMSSVSGISDLDAFIGDLVFEYTTVFGE